MSAASSDRKDVSRRRFLSFLGGASGFAAVSKIAAGKAESLFSAKPASATEAGAAMASASAAPPLAAPVVSATTATTDLVSRELSPADASVRQLFGSIGPGANVFGWKVVNIHGVQFGAIPVVMENPKGERFQVDVCLRDQAKNAPRAVADAGTLSFFLSNQGAGGTPTDESHGLGAVALATAMTRAAGKLGPSVRAPGMLTLQQRYARYPGGAYSVPA